MSGWVGLGGRIEGWCPGMATPGVSGVEDDHVECVANKDRPRGRTYHYERGFIVSKLIATEGKFMYARMATLTQKGKITIFHTHSK